MVISSLNFIEDVSWKVRKCAEMPFAKLNGKSELTVNMEITFMLEVRKEKL